MSIPIYIFLYLTSFLYVGDMPHVSKHPSEERKDLMVIQVNKLRSKGCYCGSEYMPPAAPVRWNELLYNSALSHAKEMREYNFFSHFSANGLDIGDRLDGFGYRWQVAGENLGEGQRSFNEVMNDWVDSPSHCKMLMNPKVEEMGVARHHKYWVQHFGKQMPKGARRVKK